MNQSTTTLVSARGIYKDHGRGGGRVRAVDGVDLEVAGGETLEIMGPSGCGKSTLLHLLGGLDRPSAGEVWLAERRIDRLSERALAQLRRHEIGFVFQAYHLMDELTAQENVELPALLAGRSPLYARRPRRLLLSVCSVAITTSGLVAVLIVHATSTTWSVGPQVAVVTTIISVMLIVLAAVNAVFVAWTTALETRHAAALARALGATPPQITTGLSVALLGPALCGALLGIPAGIGIYDGGRKAGALMTLPPVLVLIAMVVLTLLVIGVLTAIPTRIGARRSVADILQTESP